MDIFESKNISPMLLEHISKPFNSEDYIFELKLDGIRCLAYLDERQTILKNKRNKDVTDVYPELKQIHKQIKKRCILDGELVSLNKDGSPNFFALQKRSLLTDKFRIELEMEKNKVNFVAYDILYLDDKQTTNLTLTERKKLLKNNIKENELLSISRIVENEGIKLFELTQQLSLEGIVAKKKTSTYQIGKRSKDWIKIKNLIDEDFYICGLMFDKDNQIKDLVLTTKANGKYINRGKVYLNISKDEQNFILKFALKHTKNKPLFDIYSDKNILWIEPKLVCTVQYMMLTKDGKMRQPVFKGLRTD